MQLKTQETIDIEKKLYSNTVRMGVYGAFEVTFGRERVDYITVDRKGIWRAYEVKVTKADFHSKAAKSFIGNYNYYVMPEWLYEEVRAEIPTHIGVMDGVSVLKKPKKVPLSLPVETLFINIVCALNREADKYYNNQDEDIIAKYRRALDRLEKEKDKNYKNMCEWMDKYYRLKEKVESKESNLFSTDTW
jgi:hypothetical protein